MDAQHAELEALAQEQADAAIRIAELEALIKSDAASIVKRSRAQVELISLQKRYGAKTSRPSVRALMGSRDSGGVVTKNAQKVEREIQRMELERQEREAEITKLREELHNKELSAQRRRQLEEQLREAEKAHEEALAVEEELSESAGESGSESDKAAADGNGGAAADPAATEEVDPAVESARRKSSRLYRKQMTPLAEGDEESTVTSPGTPGFLASPAGQHSFSASLTSPDSGKSSEGEVVGPSAAKALPRVPSLDEADGGEGAIATNNNDNTDLLARIEELERQVKQWKAKAAELEEDKKELEEDKMMQNEEILSLKNQRALAPPQRPSLSTSGRSMGSSRRFSTRALGNTSLRDQMKRQSTMGLTMEKQMRAEAQLEVQALEDRLKEIDGEKGELLAELEVMRSILQNTEDDGDKKKKVERLVYQLSCKKCNKHMNYVGTTSLDLKTMIGRHIDRVVVAATKAKGKDKGNSPKSPGDAGTNGKGGKEGGPKVEKWADDFAQHFAKHCKSKIGFKSVSEKDVIKFCQSNIKVEVLRRQDGAELYWECDEE